MVLLLSYASRMLPACARWHININILSTEHRYPLIIRFIIIMRKLYIIYKLIFSLGLKKPFINSNRSVKNSEHTKDHSPFLVNFYPLESRTRRALDIVTKIYNPPVYFNRLKQYCKVLFSLDTLYLSSFILKLCSRINVTLLIFYTFVHIHYYYSHINYSNLNVRLFSHY